MSLCTDAQVAVLAEIRVPRETVNDDVVIILAWHCAHGERVRAGDPIVSIETSKAVVEIEAEAKGYVEIRHREGAKVRIGELIGKVVAKPPLATAGDTGSSSHTVPDLSRTTPMISRKAMRLIEEYRIDPAVFAGVGMVRETDVIHYLEKGGAEHEGAAPGLSSSAARIDSRQATASVRQGPYVPNRGGFWGDAVVSARERGRPLFWVVWNYLWRNWLLGNLARWAPRGLILPIHRLRGVKMGKDVFVDPTAILETAYPENVVIGNDVRITAGCIVMTHIKAPHYLRETGIMPAQVRPVVLEDHCFIGVNSVIMPGVTVGKAAVVACGSVVMSSVPPYTMVQGNPAKVIKRFPRPGDR